MPGHRASYASMHDCAAAVVATHGLAGLRRRRSRRHALRAPVRLAALDDGGAARASLSSTAPWPPPDDVPSSPCAPRFLRRYRGLLPNMAKAVPSLSISYVVFENVKRLLSPTP